MLDDMDVLNNVIDFYFETEMHKEPFTLREIKTLENNLDDPAFVEDLIGTVIKKIKSGKVKNFAKTKRLYLMLNDLRFDLEF